MKIKNFFIIGTTHEENGSTTVDDLAAEIKRISPDVIFEEIPVNMLEDIYVNHKFPDSMEVKAVRKYIEQNPGVKHFGIDIKNLPQLSSVICNDDADGKTEELVVSLPESSCLKKTFLKLKEMDSLGSKAINSTRHFALTKKYNRLLDRYLLKNDICLYYSSRRENNFHFEIRECFMMNEIKNKFEQQEFKRPLLIIGYYHLPTISKKIKKLF